MIPARMGSERLARKNLVLLDGKPLIAHVLTAAKESGVFHRIIVNADHQVFADIAAEYGAEFYSRPPHLATSEAGSDDVVYDFFQKHPADIVAWVNPIAPLQPAAEIAEVVNHFTRQNLDSLITVREEQVHCNFKGEPLNYSRAGKFAKTQDLEPVQRFVYSLMMWRTAAFVDAYEKTGQAILCGNTGFYPVSRLSSIIVKYETDIRLCRAILAGQKADEGGELEYYPVPGEA
jgi:CMP-N-acetylneuraminic acid synthetase